MARKRVYSASPTRVYGRLGMDRDEDGRPVTRVPLVGEDGRPLSLKLTPQEVHDLIDLLKDAVEDVETWNADMCLNTDYPPSRITGE